MKKLINNPDDVVKEALEGMVDAYPDLLRIDVDNQVILRSDAPVQGKVGIVSGGGSGHEPMHGGFVGMGMLDAACPGQVFTSPVPDQILEATTNVDGGAGVLHIVKNYTGDVMNFEMAAELAKALPKDAILVSDGALVQTFSQPVFRVWEPASYLDQQPFAAMGVGLPLALGAAAAARDAALDGQAARRVMLSTGDGAFGYYPMEVASAVEAGLSLTIAVHNNGSWGAERLSQMRSLGRLVNIEFGIQSYERMAEAMGARGVLIEKPEHLGPALDRALAEDCVTCPLYTSPSPRDS